MPKLLVRIIYGAASGSLAAACIAAQPDRGPSSDWSRRATRVG